MAYPQQTIHLLRCILILAVLVMYQNVVRFPDLSGCLLAEAAYKAICLAGAADCKKLEERFRCRLRAAFFFEIEEVKLHGGNTADCIAQKQRKVGCGLPEKPHGLCAES
ncbi:MAG: hypothetical protein ACLROS_05565 [Faecalibacterium sp.]